MKTLLKQSVLLLGLMTAASTYLPLPASADSTADLIMTLKCPNDYIVNVWQRYDSGELLYRGSGLLGNLKLGKGENNSTGAAQVYKFRSGSYEYQALGGRWDDQEQGSLTVFRNGRSILTQACTREG